MLSFFSDFTDGRSFIEEAAITSKIPFAFAGTSAFRPNSCLSFASI